MDGLAWLEKISIPLVALGVVLVFSFVGAHGFSLSEMRCGRGANVLCCAVRCGVVRCGAVRCEVGGLSCICFVRERDIGPGFWICTVALAGWLSPRQKRGLT